MSFKASLLLTADGKQAQAELKKVSGALDKAGRSAEQMGRKGKGAARATKQLSAAEREAAAAAKAKAAAEKKAAEEALKLERANRRAAAQVGNLTAQFNDIGMMMAAGQNPLQLAIQQGTQITQVIGPMGAAGAAKALGAAFMSLFSPINLITLGSIAAGAAMVGWLTDAGEEAKSFADTVEELGGAVDAYRTIVDEAGASTEALAERFGTGASKAREYLLALAEVKRREALIGAQDAGAQLTAPMRIEDASLRMREVADQFGIGDPVIGLRRMERRRVIAPVMTAYRELEAAANASLAEQIAAWERTYDAVQAASEAVDGVSREENERLALIAQQILRLRELQAADEAVARTRQNAWAEYVNSRQKGEEFLARARAREQAQMAAIYGQYVQTRAAAEGQVRGAEELLGKLEAQNALQEAILRFGEGSAEVARLRAEAERAAFDEMLAGMDVAESLKDELRQAFEHGQALAGLDMAGGIVTASNNARALAEWLGVSLETASRLAALGPQGIPQSAGRGRGRDPRQFGGGIADWQNRDAIVFLESWRPQRSGGSGTSRRAGSTTDPTAKLLASLQAELDLMRTLDPVMREMIRNREALKGATDAEREAVRALIMERLAEEDVLARRELFTDTLYDAFDKLIFQGASFADVMGDVARAIERAALQALLLGEGPLASLFGLQGGGGLLGGLAGAILPGFARGGVIHGPGSGTSDQVPILASNGEFIVTAEATRRNRHILEAMNAGLGPARLADGGPVMPPALSRPRHSAQPPAGAEAGAQIINHFHISTPDARSFSENRVAVARGAARILEQARRYG